MTTAATFRRFPYDVDAFLVPEAGSHPSRWNGLREWLAARGEDAELVDTEHGVGVMLSSGSVARRGDWIVHDVVMSAVPAELVAVRYDLHAEMLEVGELLRDAAGEVEGWADAGGGVAEIMRRAADLLDDGATTTP